MDFRKKNTEFKKRFGIADPQPDPAKEFNTFKQRILNIFESIDTQVTKEGMESFCTLLGKEIIRYNNFALYNSNIIDTLKTEYNENPFYFLIELIFSLPFVETEPYSSKIVFYREDLLKKVWEAFHISDINASITMVNNEVIIYPRGEAVLDNNLIEEVFSFLNTDSQKHFVAALTFYKKFDQESFIKSTESIRRCVEEFLRFKLGNKKGLKQNINELLNYHKNTKNPSDLRNIIQTIFSHLDNFFNEHSKHNDGDIGEAENEFLLYQSGLLMRYIHKSIK